MACPYGESQKLKSRIVNKQPNTMEECGNLLEALKLLVVGMGTVFVVLLIIIEGGKLLIKAVNKFVPEEEVVSKKVVTAQPEISPVVTKAINAAIDKISGGQAQVLDIKKL